jgi:hypothetical protein
MWLLFVPALSATGVLRCHDISDSVERLACYDIETGRVPSGEADNEGEEEAVPATPTPTPTPTPAPVPADAAKWTVTTKVDPITDAKVIVAILPAGEGDSRLRKEAALILRCSPRPSFYVDWDDFMSTENVLVLARFDDGPTSNSYWDISTNYESTFFTQPGLYFEKLAAADKLVVRATPHGETPATVTFDVRGFRAHVDEMMPLCAWWGKKPDLRDAYR